MNSFLTSASANYVDIAMMSFIGLSFAYVAVFFSFTCKRVFHYLFKWAVAFTILQLLLYVLNGFPAYALLRSVAWSTLQKVLGKTGIDEKALSAWEFAKQEAARRAQEYVTKNNEL